MLVSGKVDIILMEMKVAGIQIPSYLEERYRKAVGIGLTKIDSRERTEKEKNRNLYKNIG